MRTSTSIPSLRGLPTRSRVAALSAVLVGGLVLAACEEPRPAPDLQMEEAPASPPADPGIRHDMSAPPEATSLFGEPLYPIVPDSAARATMEAQLDSALARYEADPDDAEALIWLGRRLAYLGRYQDAIDAFSEGIERHPDDPRFYRHRGHRFLSVRDLDRAIEDLEHAARLVGGEDDEVEPDGQPNAAGVPRSTLQTNVWYHLGLARYVQADFRGAIHAFRRGLELSPNDDMRVAMADWLWLALTRTGRQDEARALLDRVLTNRMEILENRAYERRLRLYAGQIPPDNVLPEDPDALALATYGYGLGTWHLVQGDTLAARALYDDLFTTGYWPAFGYLAAEAEVARLDGTGGAGGANR